MREYATVNKNLVAKASIAISAPKAHVWNALVDPAAVKQSMMLGGLKKYVEEQAGMGQ